LQLPFCLVQEHDIGMSKRLVKTECSCAGLSEAAKVSVIFKCLGDANRLRLLLLLADGPITVGELAKLAGTNQANTSKHLSLLSRHNLVVPRRVGTSVYYALCDGTVPKFIDVMSSFCGKQAKERSRQFSAVQPVS